MRTRLATAVFLPLVLLSIWAGASIPAGVAGFIASVSVKQWYVALLVYCFIASVIPMWLLLQPRGYLGGWFLYLTIIIGLVGAVFGGFSIQYPAFNLDGLNSLATGKMIFPILFITVACGACSGFHAIVSSGTTSRQLNRDTDAKAVGYGSMLLEGVVAVLALATLMMLPRGSIAPGSDPNLIYANGIARYLGLVGVNFNLAFAFALLAFSTFVYDTLDVCTRLARYVFQELTGWKTGVGTGAATFVTLLVPFAILMLTTEKGYLVAWPVFGTSNQLMASLTLLAVSVWLIRTGRKAFYALVPMVFMLAVTLWALVLLALPFINALRLGAGMKPDIAVSGVFGIILFVLAVWLVIEAVNALKPFAGKPGELPQAGFEQQ